MKRPASLVYSLDEVPPAHVTALNAVQHVGLIAINLVYALLVVHLAGTSPSGGRATRRSARPACAGSRDSCCAVTPTA